MRIFLATCIALEWKWNENSRVIFFVDLDEKYLSLSG